MRSGVQHVRTNDRRTASVVALRPMLAFARTKGVDADAILAEIGVPPSALDDFDLRIPEAARRRAWRIAAERAGDPAFGLHVAEHAPMGSFDVLDYSVYFSATLGEALDRVVHFYRVLCDGWAKRLDVRPSGAHLSLCEASVAQMDEASLALIVVRARQLTGSDVRPLRVKFQHAAPPDTTQHARLFRSPVTFGCATSELVLATRDLALPITSANQGVASVLDRYMTDLLARLPASVSFVDHARAAIAATLQAGRAPTLDTTAKRLHASRRTVQRRLDAEGTSHSEIVRTVRRESAEHLVAEGRMSITEIAFLLGFADVSGFRRMYKQWTGEAPSRRRMHG